MTKTSTWFEKSSGEIKEEVATYISEYNEEFESCETDSQRIKFLHRHQEDILNAFGDFMSKVFKLVGKILEEVE